MIKEKLNKEIYEKNFQVADLLDQLQGAWESISQLERELTQLQQYTRKDNIEISGLPDDIPHNKLEDM